MALVSLTLHVGIGTFRPIQVTKLADHKMHSERGELSESVVKRLNAARAEGGASLRSEPPPCEFSKQLLMQL